MKRIAVFGAGGFIGSHLVNRLKKEDNYVIGVDLVLPAYNVSLADEFVLGDLRDPIFCAQLFKTSIYEIYQLAADMGGAGYIFTGHNDADILHNSALINLNVANQLIKNPNIKIFFSSSACVYPKENQEDPDHPNCAENTVYPANPDSEYGWEKIFSERLYQSLEKNYNISIRIARYHNIFGPGGSWDNGKEKAPAAICRKVAMSADGESIDIWGDGKQTRSFLYIDDCLDATLALMSNDFSRPINIGSDEMVSVTELTQQIIAISGKKLLINYISGPTGVRGRTSDNRLIKKTLGWTHTRSLTQGLEDLYCWILKQTDAKTLGIVL